MSQTSDNAIPCSAVLWRSFQAAAKRRRRDPAKLISEFMQQCLEDWEDQQLDEAIRRDARRSGAQEADAVEIVRRHRAKKNSGVAS